jgi:carbohydrate-selective porin OprB
VDIHDLMTAAREHADRLASDVELCSTREEHVRLTARANEAENIANDLYTYVIALTAADTLG